MIQLVLFDVDGTLIHSGGAGVKAFARAFASEVIQLLRRAGEGAPPSQNEREVA